MVKVCRSTSRKDSEMGFARFVPPEFDLERAALWIRKLCRPEFGIGNITRFTYVCQRHFHPDTYDYDYRSNLELTPFEEGTVLTRLTCKSWQPQSSSPSDIQPVWKTYQKKSPKSSKVKYFPMYHDVQVNTVKIDLERKLTFFLNVEKEISHA